MNWWTVWFPIIIAILLIYLPRKKRRRTHVNMNIRKKKMLKGNEKMNELAKRFIGKDCYINLMEGTADGVVKEVEEGGLVLEKEDKIRVINLDYVVMIREYPYKNGKRVSIITD